MLQMDNEENKPYQAIPHDKLINELMDCRVPKTEREHAAAREIEKFKDNKKLTDEEVWLRAYLVGFQCDEITSPEQCEEFANSVLGVFKKRFRKND